jgi:hypothetical protein
VAVLIYTQGTFNAIHVHENGIRAPFRKLDLAKRSGWSLEDGADDGFERLGSKLEIASVVVVVEESVSVTLTHCSLCSHI